MHLMGEKARNAATYLAEATDAAKNKALLAMAESILDRKDALLDANREDMAQAKTQDTSSAMLDRLALDPKRLQAMANGLRDIATFPDPVGRVLQEWTRPNGLSIARVSVPLGVIGIIYESRPNVTADASGLCLKSGNAAILRGGSESWRSSRAIVAAMQDGLAAVAMPRESIQLVPTIEREAVGILLSMKDYIDLIVPRGGRGLIERVTEESRIPILMHMDGLCHTYVDGAADPDMARKIVLNAKMRRPGICGATETLLVDKKALTLLPLLIGDLINAGCEVRGDEAAQKANAAVIAATPKDWDTEYLEAIISVAIVDGIDGAIDHIRRHGSKHTEAIVTEDQKIAERFLKEIDAAILMWNASTQFADGGEFGMGAEIGISTGKLHARGPVGAEQLTTYKYLVRGQGQIRP